MLYIHEARIPIFRIGEESKTRLVKRHKGVYVGPIRRHYFRVARVTRELVTDVRAEGRYSKDNLSAPTTSASQTRRIFSPMSMTCNERPSYDISIHALKYALATLIQGVASALRHQLLEHASYCFYSIHQIIQLRKLSLGERSPAFRSASDLAETKEQVSDFSQCKTELTRTLNDCQAV